MIGFPLSSRIVPSMAPRSLDLGCLSRSPAHHHQLTITITITVTITISPSPYHHTALCPPPRPSSSPTLLLFVAGLIPHLQENFFKGSMTLEEQQKMWDSLSEEEKKVQFT